ncbi:MAG: trypsin-like peptidase domain-containing protein [Planctomycetota bacterium]
MNEKIWHRRDPGVFGWIAVGLCLVLSPSIRADDLSEGSSSTATSTPSEDVAASIAGAKTLSRAFRNAASTAAPAVVTVYSYGQNENQPRESGTEDSGPADSDSGPRRTDADGFVLTGLGSGVIVERDGRIITNNHVIANAKRVVVQMPDETEIEASEVHGDPQSDIAVIQIDPNQRGLDVAASNSPLPVVEYGDSDRVEIGDWVLAIGSPFRLDASVSAGIISAKGRTLTRVPRARLYQTDAAINPGNSGGPLVDLDGRVIAINTAIATRNGGYQGIGFAIPINQARWIANELSEHGRVRRSAIGVRLAELNPKLARRLKLPAYLGVLAYQVVADSAADRAGVQNYDVIMSFAGVRVRDAASLQEVVERQPVGSTVEIKIRREGEELIRSITLAPLEDVTAAPISPSENAPKAAPSDESERVESVGE